MNILFAGASGFIGRHLIGRATSEGHTVTLLTRNPVVVGRRIGPPVSIVEWDGRTVGRWREAVEWSDAVVNLSGESIGGRRWSAAQKVRLLESRTNSTKAIVQALASSTKKPSVLLNASAVGYYGDVPEGEVTEESPAGDDTLARICVAWEAEAREAERLGLRVVLARSGVVLDDREGALPRLLTPFRLFVGGHLGSGHQWFPWVHRDDEVEALYHAIVNPALSGPVNIAAPEQARMRDFCRALGSVLRRPSWAPVPAFVLRIVLGEMAGPLLLSGQMVVSGKLAASGFAFRHPLLFQALTDVLGDH